MVINPQATVIPCGSGDRERDLSRPTNEGLVRLRKPDQQAREAMIDKLDRTPNETERLHALGLAWPRELQATTWCKARAGRAQDAGEGEAKRTESRWRPVFSSREPQMLQCQYASEAKGQRNPPMINTAHHRAERETWGIGLN